MKKRIGNPQQFHVRCDESLSSPGKQHLLNRATYFRNFCLLILLSLAGMAQAQNVAINADGAKPNKNAMLDIQSANKGLLIPRMTSDARLKIENTQGLLVYDINTNSFWYNTGKAWQNMSAAAALAATGAWDLNGNAGTVDGVNFIGTTDNVPFNVRVNNHPSGRIDATLNNSFWGYKAGIQMTTGHNNVAVGDGTLFMTTNGFDNTAVGSLALRSNTGGFSNSAFGRLALQSNTTGSYNTAIGQAALQASTYSNENVAVGVGAMFGHSSGNSNTAVGTNAMYIGGGAENTAVGSQAMSVASAGQGNTAVGFQANPIGSFSTAVGYQTFVQGYNSTALGNGATVNVPNKVRIGNSAVTVIEGQVPFTTPSDGRFKFAIQEDVKGLDFVMQLRPVTYQFDVRRFDEQLGNDKTTGGIYDEAERMRRTGFIAQEVEQAALKSGYNFSGIIKPKSASDHYSLSYDAFVVPLVKAVQEQQDQITELKKELDEMKKMVQQLITDQKNKK